MAKGLPKFSEDDILKALQERKRTVDATRALRGGMVATLEIKSQFDDSRMDVIRDMSQKEADRIIGVVRNEEMKLAGAMKSAATNQNQPLIQLLNFYRDSLQRIYYQSTQQKTAVIGESEIEQTYLPQIEKLIQAIKQDKILKEYKVTTTVLQLAEKIKQELVNRTKLKTKLKDSAKNKISGFLGKDSAFSKSNLVGLALSAFLNRKQSKNSYAIAAQNNQQNLNTQQAQTRAETDAVEFEQQKQDAAKKERDAIAEKARRQRAKKGKGATPEATTTKVSDTNMGVSPILTADGTTQPAVTPGGSGLVGADGQPLSSLPTAPELSAPVSSSLDGSGSEIVKILSQHTSLLGKIFGVNSQMLKLQQDKMAKDAAAAEESGLETQGGGKERTGLLPTATKEEEEQGGGGFMGLAMNLLSSRFPMLRGLRGAGGLLRGGARLGGGLLRGGARLGGRLAGLGLGAAAGATATAVASSSADDIAKTATKAIGTETAEAATKTLGKKAAETGAKKGISASIKGLIKKKVPSTIGKIVGKGIPGLGWLIGGGFAISRLVKGDVVGAGLELGASAGSLLTSIPLTIVSLTRDVYTESYGTPPEIDSEAAPRLGEIKTGVTEAVDEELEKLGLKEKKKDDAVIQKSEQDLESAKAETPPPTSGETTPTATEAPPAPSSAPPTAGPAGGPAPTTTDAPAPSAPPAPKPSGFFGRLVKGATKALQYATPIGLTYTATKKMMSDKLFGGGQSGGGGATGSFAGNPSEVLEFGGESGQLQNFQGLHPAIQNKVLAAGQEYLQKTKKKLKVNSAKRDPAKQQQLWDESVKAGRPGRGPSGMAIARPGRSRHERGLAIDIQNYRDPIAVAALNRQGLFQGVPGDPVHFQLDGNPSLDQPVSPAEGATDTGASQSTGAATQAPPNVAETGGGNAGSAPPAPTTASAGGDTTATGRAVIAGSIAAPAAAPAGGGGGNVTNIMQGGTTLAGGGGGGSASTPIPAPIDREPTIRRILDGALT